MKLLSLREELKVNAYPGRGIVLGRSDNGNSAVIAYFIMGRSENSRNRIFVADGSGIRTQAFDESKVTDPSLIIYAPVRVFQNETIVTNGDQTDTIYEGLSQGKGFAEALTSRTFEPDRPNYTPRISGLMHTETDYMRMELSILKSDNGNPEALIRGHFEYLHPMPGEGRFLHTYRCDGDPLPSFEGEPKLVEIEGSIDIFTELIWESLNPDNRVSLFVRYIDLKTNASETRIINRHEGREE